MAGQHRASDSPLQAYQNIVLFLWWKCRGGCTNSSKLPRSHVRRLRTNFDIMIPASYSDVLGDLQFWARRGPIRLFDTRTSNHLLTVCWSSQVKNLSSLNTWPGGSLSLLWRLLVLARQIIMYLSITGYQIVGKIGVSVMESKRWKPVTMGSQIDSCSRGCRQASICVHGIASSCSTIG